jgi:hypothetical protein
MTSSFFQTNGMKKCQGFISENSGFMKLQALQIISGPAIRNFSQTATAEI